MPGHVTVTSRGVGVEAITDGHRSKAPVGHLSAGQVVDGDVAPCRIVGWQVGHVGEPVPLPWRVVVVEDCRPSPQHVGHRLGGRRVQRDGAKVFHHHEVGALQCLGQHASVGWSRFADADPVYDPDRSRVVPAGFDPTGHPIDVKAQDGQGVGP